MSEAKGKDRSHQRYSSNGARQVAVAIIFAPPEHVTHKFSLSNETSTSVGVWLVTSRNHANRLTPPKGGWESFDATVAAAAQREAIEEAGIETRQTNCDVIVAPDAEGKGKDQFHFVNLIATSYLDTFLEVNERTRICVPLIELLSSPQPFRLRSVVDNSEEVWTMKETFVRGFASLSDSWKEYFK